jgi:hypothetical protein
MPQNSSLGVFVALIGNSLIGASFSIMKVGVILVMIVLVLALTERVLLL